MPHCALPGATRAEHLSGSNVSAWMPTASTPARRDLVEHPEVVRRLELDLDREPARLLDRVRAARDVDRAAVAPVQRARGQRDVDGVVVVARRRAHLGQHRRRLDRHRLLAARELDPAEPALLRRVPVDALLHDRGRDRVQVQQRDLPVRDAVRGLHVVDLRPRRQRDRARRARRRGTASRAVRPPCIDVRRRVDERGVRRHRQRQPAHPQEHRVRRAGAAAAAGHRARRLVDDADAERLQLDQQLPVVQRQRLRHGCRRPLRSCARTRGL